MGLFKKLMKRKTDEDVQFICKNCRGNLYPLEESVENIYICESCGKSFDYDTLEEQENNSEQKTPVYLLFNEQFMKKYTNFNTFDDFLRNCPFLEEQITEEFNETIPLKHPRKWKKYVKDQTMFSSWNEMFEKAIEIHLHI